MGATESHGGCKLQGAVATAAFSWRFLWINRPRIASHLLVVKRIDSSY